MTRRYFAPQLPAQGGMVSLDEAETHHAIHVMRIREGECVTLFDGAGSEAIAKVHAVGRREVFCEAEPALRIDRENQVSLVLGIAMPKGDRSKELVERLTELGVNQLVPLHCKRTQWAIPENAIIKWQRVVIDACKQSGRNTLMQIESPQPAASWFRCSSHGSTPRFVAHPDAASGSSPFAHPPWPSTESRAIVAIGPEGGFSDEEVAVADQHGWQRLSLGDRIYRIETAAIIAAIKISRL